MDPFSGTLARAAPGSGAIFRNFSFQFALDESSLQVEATCRPLGIWRQMIVLQRHKKTIAAIELKYINRFEMATVQI